ncbi:hypothetical protein [Dongia sp.]|uniref:hypothetical protein n=1 Tax=Dongia sp. TaxID=1977262 RepID=UPI0035B095C0
MDWKVAFLGIGATLAVAGLSAAPAAACPCPKQKMIEMYGTVSAYGPKVTQTQKSTQEAATLTVSDLAEAAKPQMALPTPASDQVTASFQQILAADPY